MLAEMIKRFAEAQPGATSFTTFADDCLSAAERDADNAASLVLLAMAGREFVDQVQDQPLSLSDAEAGRRRLIALAEQVQSASADGVEARMAVANRIALEQIRQAQ